MKKPRLKILVVDDETEARVGLARLLRAKGYEVSEAATGGEVLSRAREEWPNLIVLDIVLPDITGTDVFKMLRADPITKMIPVLLLTAKPDIVNALPASEKPDRIIAKPRRPDDLLQIIHQMLTGKK